VLDIWKSTIWLNVSSSSSIASLFVGSFAIVGCLGEFSGKFLSLWRRLAQRQAKKENPFRLTVVVLTKWYHAIHLYQLRLGCNRSAWLSFEKDRMVHNARASGVYPQLHTTYERGLNQKGSGT
jgi:hypothetical protein